jgi:predicted flap endonuclease-1-like 5' DNA nuclease
MALLSDYKDFGAFRGQAEKAMGMPLGLASPLWLAFGAATTAGVAWWWMTRWTKALNIEALAPTPAPVAKPAPAPAPPAAVAKPAPIAIAAPVEIKPAPAKAAPARAPVEAVAAPVAKAKPVKAAPAKAPEPAPLVLAEPDDLTVLVGIGPKLADALAARGVTRYAQIAAWKAKDLAHFDAALSLKGRAVREAWVAQAQRLAKGEA